MHNSIFYDILRTHIPHMHHNENTMKNQPTMEEQLAQITNLIQQGMNKKNFNTAALANSIGMERKELKRVLSGQRDITMREFISISTALELDASMIEEYQAPQQEENIEPFSLSNEAPAQEEWTPDPLENHTRQLVALGFALGCNMLLLCNVEHLKNANIPQDVIAQFHPQLPIQLDAAYHPYNKPQYYDEGLELKLSFDALYTCFLPWNSINQVIFRPEIEETEQPPEPPSLRLV